MSGPQGLMLNVQTKDELLQGEYEEDELLNLIPSSEKVSSRVGNTEWCLCGGCGKMETEKDSVCCQEQPPVLLRLMQWNQQGSCILQHPFFVSVCLNPYALHTIYNRDKKLFGALSYMPLHKKYQITAYRTFNDYFFNCLRGSLMTPIPSCVLNTIRKSFPKDATVGSFPGYIEL